MVRSLMAIRVLSWPGDDESSENRVRTFGMQAKRLDGGQGTRLLSARQQPLATICAWKGSLAETLFVTMAIVHPHVYA